MRILDLLMLTCIERSYKPLHILCAAFLALMERSCELIMEMEEPMEVINLVHRTVSIPQQCSRLEASGRLKAGWTL